MSPKEMRTQLTYIIKHAEHLSIVDVRAKYNEYFKPKTINTQNVQHKQRSKRSTS